MAYYDVHSDDGLDEANDLARSAFGDMLLDEDRNLKFRNALRFVINKKHQDGEVAHVIDIGTGCGLLSLYAAEAGADQVTALEVFPPVAKIAKKVFDKSQYADKIRLITSRSTDLLIPLDDNEKGNILVAEVFDTELIGEGALRTFKEAFRTLVLPEATVVPSLARVWALPIQSKELRKFTDLPASIKKLPFFEGCPGCASVFDLQASALKPDVDFLSACPPFVVFSFNFSDPDSLIFDETFTNTFEIVNKVVTQLDAVIVWWELDMLGDSSTIINLAPEWQDPRASWRDHWMQCIYFFPESLPVVRGEIEVFNLHSFHDEFSLWFDVSKNFSNTRKISPPACTCGIHNICSRNEIYRFNTMEDIYELIQPMLHEDVYCLGEGSFMGIHLASNAKKYKNTKKFCVVDLDDSFINVLKRCASAKKIDNCKFFNSLEDSFSDAIPRSLSVILDPHHLSCDGTLDSFLKTLCDIRKVYSKLSNYDVDILPTIEFDDLWKVNSHVGTVDGFNFKHYDEQIQHAKYLVDAPIESHSLWEYSSKTTSVVKEIFTVDLANKNALNFLKSDILILKVDLAVCAGTNAIAFWSEAKVKNNEPCRKDIYYNDGVIDRNLEDEIDINVRPSWNRSYRQSVHFLPSAINFEKVKNVIMELKINFQASKLSEKAEVLLDFDYSLK